MASQDDGEKLHMDCGSSQSQKERNTVRSMQNLWHRCLEAWTLQSGVLDITLLHR